MDKLILNILVSSGFAALISGVFTLLNKLFEYKNDSKKEMSNFEKEYMKSKEVAYIQAINSLLFFKRGFSITKDDLIQCDKEHEEYITGCEKYRSTQAILRLYATDDVFALYSMLLAFKKFAYVSSNQWRLSENSKQRFDDGITLLSRMMQKELGFRRYDKSALHFICPVCGRQHDFLETCKCGLKYQDLIREIENSNSMCGAEM